MARVNVQRILDRVNVQRILDFKSQYQEERNEFLHPLFQQILDLCARQYTEQDSQIYRSVLKDSLEWESNR